MDECAVNPQRCGLNSVCRNVIGSYACECSRGYTGNGTTCTGENRVECSLFLFRSVGYFFFTVTTVAFDRVCVRV